MDTAVTVSPQDAFFIEYHREKKGARSRSAVIREALRLLRETTLEEERAAGTRPAAGRIPGRDLSRYGAAGG
ncbi:ribbon-helix-helix protein, CopG family [Streptosporangium sp. NPDC048047]|uniref:ribbon-helix-helix protein, CopG family n=1 Tax=Streptosporangium sp. NPDC048047 TaxID=3155748 RepID=UPI0034367A5F